MNMTVSVPVAATAPVPETALPSPGQLNYKLAEASAADIVRTARDVVGREDLAVVSSFGIESAALLKVVADVDPAIPVLFIDTGWLFQETLAYRDAVTKALGLRDVRTLHPAAAQVAQRDPGRELWNTDPNACCALRKVEPLSLGLLPFRGWINGRKRFQGGLRAALPIVETDGARLKFNPFANMTPAAIAAIYRSADLPRHPMAQAGFTSIGCLPCSSRTQAGEDPRAGRWRGRDKTECGIHTAAEL